MKKITIVAAMLLSASLFAQQGPIGPAINPNVNTALKANHAWYRGGNNLGGPAGSKNIFGTMWNSPIYTYTNGVGRGIRNGDRNQNINGFNVNTNGYMGLGPNSIGAGHNNGLWEDIGPFSLLHLNGVTAPGDFVFPGGYRPWMRTGITFSDQIDLAYVGLRSVDVANNINEMVINWSNDPASNQYGPDDMVFRFSRGNQSTASSISSNFSSDNDLDGLHIARFTGTGELGLGPTFGVPQSHANYVRPQSIMHISEDNSKATWLQITNENGTGQAASDGLRLGFRNTNTSPNGEGYLRWQENTAFLIQTDWNAVSGGINNGERMRISSINAPGVPNPNNLNNITRVAISHSGNQPITEPRSLLHLGYNTSATAAGANGWRDWMDVGTFIANSTDIMYMGLKDEGFNRQDAVINWGDNGPGNPASGPDNLRFIFTSNAQVPGNPTPSNTPDGLEIARMVPTVASTLVSPNYGMMGIGDFTLAPAIDAKLDIDGDLRIRQVTQDNALTQVLVIDPADQNRVHWLDASNLGGGFAGDCLPQNAVPFVGDKYADLDGFNFHFAGNSGLKSENNVAIGSNCNFPLPGKLTVNQNTTNEASTGIWVRNNDDAHITDGSPVSLFALATGNDLQVGCNTVAGWFEARPSSGQQNLAIVVPQNGGVVNIGFATPDLTTPPNEPNVCANQLGTLGGLLAVNGPISATGYITNPSDISFKTNITPIASALEKVKKLNGVYYDYDNTNYPNLNFPSARQVGLIAQNVDTVLTEVTVYDSSLQAFTMDYSRINALLIEAIKEQDNKVDSLENLATEQDSINNDLETRLAILEQCINEANLCSQQAAKVIDNSNNGQTIELSNLNAIILDQNLPNPFAENTTINYSIPEDVNEAQLLFYDMNGRIIKQVDITDRGDSKLTVYGDNLQKGIYTYSLIADGKLIATKKMVKQ